MLTFTDYKKDIASKVIKSNTKQADYLRSDARRTMWAYDDIYEAYNSPSIYKVRSFNAIKERCRETNGYNNDLKIIGKNSSTYSTIYTFTENGVIYAVKDTKDNTYIVEL